MKRRLRRRARNLPLRDLDGDFIRGSHLRDEQLHGAHFTGDEIENVDGVAGEIDEHLPPTWD